MGHRSTTKPAPTPVSKLGPLFKRQQKYHPARPYSWWELKPSPPEAPPEAFYRRKKTPEEYTAARRQHKPDDLAAGILSVSAGFALAFGSEFFAIVLLLIWLDVVCGRRRAP
jgi:hypothetical protein